MRLSSRHSVLDLAPANSETYTGSKVRDYFKEPDHEKGTPVRTLLWSRTFVSTSWSSFGWQMMSARGASEISPECWLHLLLNSNLCLTLFQELQLTVFNSIYHWLHLQLNSIQALGNRCSCFQYLLIAASIFAHINKASGYYQRTHAQTHSGRTPDGDNNGSPGYNPIETKRDFTS